MGLCFSTFMCIFPCAVFWLISLLCLPVYLRLIFMFALPDVLGRQGIIPGSVPALDVATSRQPSPAAADGLIKSVLFKSVAALQSLDPRVKLATTTVTDIFKKPQFGRDCLVTILCFLCSLGIGSGICFTGAEPRVGNWSVILGELPWGHKAGIVHSCVFSTFCKSTVLHYQSPAFWVFHNSTVCHCSS